jgi:hypothetical protein
MYGVCVCDFMRAWDPIQSRLGVCMQWGAHAQVGRFATGGDVSGLLGWGLFWAFFFFSRVICYIQILYNQQKEAIGNDSREAKRPKAW